MKVISIINNKGGVGKTTITQNVSVCIANKGYKIGIIDFDSQANLSFCIQHTPKKDLRNILLEKKPISIDDFSKTVYENLYILPNKRDINSSVFNSFNPAEQTFMLYEVIKNLTDFDYILIDTPPSLDLPTFNAMIASKYIIIPVEYEVFSAIGLSVLYDNINSAKKINKDLEVLGILATKVYEGRKINKMMQEPMVKRFGNLVFQTSIRTNEKFKQAQEKRTDIFNYEKIKSEKKGSEDIDNLSAEIINKITNLN